MIKQDRGIPFSVTSIGTSTAVATQSAGTNVIWYVTDISASGTISGSVTLYIGTTGTVPLWGNQLTGSGSNFGWVQTFSEPLGSPAGQGLRLVTSGGTILSYANISGFGINLV